MTPQERALVDDLFDRLAKLETAPRDPEAEQAIRAGFSKAPNALYALVQSVLVQDEALKRADARIRELEGGDGAPSDGQPRGFLDNMRDGESESNDPIRQKLSVRAQKDLRSSPRRLYQHHHQHHRPKCEVTQRSADVRCWRKCGIDTITPLLLNLTHMRHRLLNSSTGKYRISALWRAAITPP
jgi:hypothetical protein